MVVGALDGEVTSLRTHIVPISVPYILYSSSAMRCVCRGRRAFSRTRFMPFYLQWTSLGARAVDDLPVNSADRVVELNDLIRIFLYSTMTHNATKVEK